VIGGSDEALRFARQVCDDPAATIARWKTLSGRKAIGCLGGDIPEEAIAAAGMLPVTLQGDEFIRLDRRNLPDDLGSARRGLAAAIRTGRLDAVDAWVMTVRPGEGREASLTEALSDDGRPFFRLAFSGSPGNEAAADRLDAVEALIEWAGRLSGRPVTDGGLDRAVRAWNESRRLFARLRERLAERPGLYAAADYVRLARAGMILPKPAHSEVIKAALSREDRPGAAPLVRVFLCGTAAPSHAVRCLDASGAALAGDDLAAGGRYYELLVEESGDPALALARRYHGKEASRLADDAGFRLFERIRASGAGRILLLRAEDEDPDGRLHEAVARMGEEQGIPCLFLDVGRRPGARRHAAARSLALFLGGEGRRHPRHRP
jgi:benzoyl-CoA reductase subunit C